MRIVFFGPAGCWKRDASPTAQGLSRHHASLDRRHAPRGAPGRHRARQPGGQLLPGRQARARRGGRRHRRRAARRRPIARAAACSTAFPRTVAQAEALDAMLAEQGMPLDLVVALDMSDDEVVFQRLASRGRPDDAVATVRERLRAVPLAHRAAGWTTTAAQGILRRIDGTRHAGRGFRADQAGRRVGRGNRSAQQPVRSAIACLVRVQ